MNGYLKGDIKNTTCLLHKIASFVRQQKLEDKMTDNISQIAEFGFMSQNFLIAIYESDWNKLVAGKNKSFRQSISFQFNKMYANNANTNKLSSKKVDVLRIPPLILPKPSKSILAKLKFYKNLLQNSKSKPKDKSQNH